MNNQIQKLLIPKKELAILERNNDIFRGYCSMSQDLSENQRFIQLAAKHRLSISMVRNIVANYSKEFKHINN